VRAGAKPRASAVAGVDQVGGTSSSAIAVNERAPSGGKLTRGGARAVLVAEPAAANGSRRLANSPPNQAAGAAASSGGA
jgi:hypothetical protein